MPSGLNRGTLSIYHISTTLRTQFMKKWLILQLSIAIAAACVMLIGEPVAAWSLLAGGGAVFVANLWFVLRVGSVIGQFDSQLFVRKTLVAEVMKFVIAGSLCAIAFKSFKTIQPVYFFAGFVLAIITNMAGLKYVQQMPPSE